MGACTAQRIIGTSPSQKRQRGTRIRTSNDSLGKLVRSPVGSPESDPTFASAVKSAWRRARERAGVRDAWFRDLRPQALSDAKRQGLSLEKLRDAAGHANVTTTEGYMRGFDVKDANLGLVLPKAKKTV